MATFKPVKITKRGKNYQLVFYNLAGERRRVSAGASEQHARKLAVQFDDWLMEGKNPELELKMDKRETGSKPITLEEFFPIFMERHGNCISESTQQFYHERFKNILRCPSLAKCYLGSVSRKLVLDYMHARLKMDGVSNSTVNRESATIMAMLNKAVEWEIIQNNPIVNLKRLPESPKRNVSLTPEEAAKIIAAIPSALRNIVEFAIYTGFRRENILKLTIEQIVFNDLTGTGEVRLKIKTGKYEVFPLGTLASEVVKRVIAKRNTGYVFINPRTGTHYKTVSSSYKRAVRRLGITVNDTPLTFHDLRHAFATWLHANSASLDQLRLLMGHSNRATTDRYTTATATDVREVLNHMPKIELLQRKPA